MLWYLSADSLELNKIKCKLLFSEVELFIIKLNQTNVVLFLIFLLVELLVLVFSEEKSFVTIGT